MYRCCTAAVPPQVTPEVLRELGHAKARGGALAGSAAAAPSAAAGPMDGVQVAAQGTLGHGQAAQQKGKVRHSWCCHARCPGGHICSMRLLYGARRGCMCMPPPPPNNNNSGNHTYAPAPHAHVYACVGACAGSNRCINARTAAPASFMLLQVGQHVVENVRDMPPVPMMDD